MKKIFTFVLAVAVAAVMLSCGSTGSKSKDSELPPGQSQIVIHRNISGSNNHFAEIQDGSGKSIARGTLNWLDKDKRLTLTVPNGSGYKLIFQGSSMSSPRGNNEFDLPNLEDAVVTISLKEEQPDEINWVYIINMTAFKGRDGSDRLAGYQAGQRAQAQATNRTLQDIGIKLMEDLDKDIAGKIKPSTGTALFPLAMRGVNISTGGLVYDAMSIELINTGNYSIIEKQKLDALLAEYDFQMSGAVGQKTIGQLLGADNVIFTTVKPNGMEAVAVDVNNFQLMGSAGIPSDRAQTPVTGVSAGEASTLATLTGMVLDDAASITVVPYGRGKLATIRAAKRSMDIQYNDPFEFWIKLQSPDDAARRADGGIVWVIYRPGVNRAEAEQVVQLLLQDAVSMGSQGIKSLDDQTASFEAAMAQLQGKVDYANLNSTARNSTIPPDTDWMKFLDRALVYYRSIKSAEGSRDRVDGRGEYVTADISPYPGQSLNKAETNGRLIADIIKYIPEGYAKSRPDIILNVSRGGSGTQIEGIRRDIPYPRTFTTSFASLAEFRRNLRVNSLRFVDALFATTAEIAYANESDRATWITSSGLNALRDNVPVPAGFVQIKREASEMNSGKVPQGGFYMAENMVTQKEYQALMGNNPSITKGDNLPVHNVNLFNAMEYCNRASLRDGLMPAYDFYYFPGTPQQLNPNPAYRTISWSKTELYTTNTKVEVRWNQNANGYRLPLPKEWEYAVKSGLGFEGRFSLYQEVNKFFDGMGDAIYDYGWFDKNSGESIHPVGQKKPINGIYDLMGNVDEWCYNGLGSRMFTPGRDAFEIDGKVSTRDMPSASIRGGNFSKSQYLFYDQARGWMPVASGNMAGTSLVAVMVNGKWERQEVPTYSTPGFRVVRPVFDYWRFIGGGSSDE